jgi:hypothetical protein
LAVGEHAQKTNGRIEGRVFFYRGTEHWKSEGPGWSLWSRTFYVSQSRDKTNSLYLSNVGVTLDPYTKSYLNPEAGRTY